MIYLDASVLIPFLYGEQEPEKNVSARQLFAAIRAQTVRGLVSFYALPELFGYVAAHYPDEEINEVFRSSLVTLFSAPVIVKPYVERAETERLRRKFSISDASDAVHVIAALYFGCSAIITFDHHFRSVNDIIPVYTPAEFFATLESSND
ncbi:MAG: PIN domain-containing protein [Chloroflexi bacterium]|nr:PIN domain-containing protein [Chloroflexota bacterium]